MSRIQTRPTSWSRIWVVTLIPDISYAIEVFIQFMHTPLLLILRYPTIFFCT